MSAGSDRAAESSRRQRFVVYEIIGIAVSVGLVVGVGVAASTDEDGVSVPSVIVAMCVGIPLVGLAVLLSVRRWDSQINWGLRKQDRKAVGRTVRTEQPSDDPEVQAAAVKVAQQEVRDRTWPRRLLQYFILLFGARGAVRWAADGWDGRWVIVGLGAAVLVGASVASDARGRRARRFLVASGEQAPDRRLDGPRTDAFAALRTSWLAWLAMAHLGLVLVIGCWLGMGTLNGLAFGYSYWNEAPPSDGAQAMAIVSLPILFLVCSLVGAAVYTGMCARQTGDRGVLAPLRRGAAVTVRQGWLAAPAFALATVACLFLLPGAFVVAWLGYRPLRHLAGGGRGTPDERVMIGLVVAAGVAIPAITAAVVGGSITSDLDGRVELVALLLIELAFVAATLAAGWGAAAFDTLRRYADAPT